MLTISPRSLHGAEPAEEEEEEEERRRRRRIARTPRRIAGEASSLEHLDERGRWKRDRKY